MGWSKHAAWTTGNGNACRYLEEAVINNSFKARIRWENNIKVEINGIGQERGPVLDMCISEQKKLAVCCEHKLILRFHNILRIL